MQNKKLLLGVGTSAVLLLIVIIVMCVLIFNSTGTETGETSVSSNEVEDKVIEVPKNEEGQNCIPEEYFDSLEEDECKLMYEEDLELTWEQPEYDPNNELPAYQQTLVTDAAKFYQTMENAITAYMEEQNFPSDTWERCSFSSNEYMAELMYRADLSTETHYIYCISSRRVDTEENMANVRIYEKVVVPDAS